MVKYGGKELAKDSAKSALSSILPSVANKVGAEIATKSVLNNLVPTVRANWVQAGDIEGMLDGKFLGVNDNYFPSVFSEGALGRATYGADRPIDQSKVDGIVRAIKNNEDIAPIAGFKNNDGFIDIYDGHHRLAAYRDAGKMPRVKLFDPANKSEAYSYADEWNKNAVKNVQQYLPNPSKTLFTNTNGKTVARHIPVQQDNYIPLYHQTSANSLDDFSLDKRSAGVSDATMPEGIFLKETDADIGLPGKNQLQLDAKLNNPIRVMDRDDLKAKLVTMDPKIAKYLRAERDIDDLYTKLSDEAQTAVDKAYEKMYYDRSEANKEAFTKAVEKMNGIIPEWREKIKENAAISQKEIKKLLKDNGYDGMIMDEDRGSFGRKVKSYLVLDKEQLRDNSVPVKFDRGSGKDLLYELKSAIDDNVYDLPDANLTPDQRDFFKDSVMRDANGNLMPLYHSTPYQFDAFDNKKLGQNTLYTNTAFGHFVTPDKDFSKRFIDINNEGKTGQTYELYANIKKPITHPYLAGKKYSGKELDKIVEDYMIATDNQDFLDTLREYAEENGTSIYDEYMDMTLGGNDPFEMAGEEKKLLEKKGYDALEIVEGTKDMLVDDATDTTPVSSYAIFDGKNLKRISNKTPSGNPGFLSKKIKIADNQASLLDYTPPKDLPVRKKEVLPTDGLKGGKTTEFNEKMKNVFGKTQFEYITGKKKPTIDDMLAALPEDKYPNTRERLKEVDKLSKSPYFSSREITNRYKNVMNGVYPSYIAEKEFGTEFKNLPIEYKKRLIYLTQENTANMSIQGDNYMGNLDKQLSEDLGIGRSNTIMTEGVGGLKSANGVYRPGPKDIGLVKNIGDTRGKSTMAHERLHAFQHAEDGDYAPEVINAVDELKKDLEHSGAYNSMDYYSNIRTLTANEKTYYNKHIEQQARMFQQYLRDKFNNNNGYTNYNPFKYETKQEYEFDPEKINPIFDKFIDRLRELSKAGYALPAILGIAVASKYLPKKEDKKS